MNLKISLPAGVSADDVAFSLPFDIDERAKKTDGHLTATREKMTVYVGSVPQKDIALDTVSGIEVRELAGCSMLCVTDKNGKLLFVCAFSQKYFLKYAELAKILDYYIKTGVFTESTDTPEPTCPKCGAKLNGASACVFCASKTGVFTKLIKRLRPYRTRFLISLLCTFVLYAADVVVPIFQRILIDDLIVPHNRDMELFFKVSACIVGIHAAKLLFRVWQENNNYKISAAYGRDLRRDIFAKIQQLSMSNVSRRTPGELINRVSSDAGVVQDFITRQGKDMILQTAALIALTVIMFVTNARLALVVVLPLPFAAYLSAKSYNFMHIRYMNTWRNHCKASELLHDVLHGIRVVKNYGGEAREAKAYEEASERWANSIKEADTAWYLFQPPINYLFSIGEYCALFFGGSMILGRQMQLGELVQFTTYVYMLYGPVQWLVNLPRVLAQAGVSAGKVFEVLEEHDDLTDAVKPVDLDIGGNIEFDHVSFGYKAYNPVLKDVSFSIKKGEMIGVVGHSGAGKSTLINLVMRLYDPTSGSVRIDGHDLREISQFSLRSQVGVVLQETFLFNGSVLDNIRYAKPEATFKDVVRAAKIANCHEFITRLPDGYDTIVGERGYNLSGGERQRVAIARAILHDPKIIILDEATASLDTQTEKQIRDALARLTEGRTTIAIAHRLSTLSGADRLLVLDKGRVAEIGTHNELLARKGVYYKLVMAQRQTAKLASANGGGEDGA
ncbi:MAG: ABC transporter ATP-binding protein [Eubacteriales bacterium]|jgi:ATP-binding cassette subfamily B protein